MDQPSVLRAATGARAVAPALRPVNREPGQAEGTPVPFERFVEALTQDEAEAERLLSVERRRRGEDAALGLLAAAARRLGEFWVEDSACFSTVTLGMTTLQRMLWRSARAQPPAPIADGGFRMLLAPVPGDQHGFGLNLLHEQLRRRGAHAVLLPAATRAELEAAVRFGAFDAVGLSVGTEPLLDTIPPLTAALRAACPTPLLMLGGGSAAARLAELPRLAGLDEVIAERPLERLCELLLGASPAVRSTAAA